jgi:hypothetical protein
MANLLLKLRVTLSENALSCLGQGIEQIRGGELEALERGGELVTEKAKVLLLRN